MTRAPHPPRAAVLAAAVLVAAGAGCHGRGAAGDGNRTGGAAATPAITAADLEAAPGGRVVVARVNGRPVYGDCVARQAAAAGGDRVRALDQCIDFELLAQEALRRGYGADPELSRARKTEMVRTLVEKDFVPTLDDPSDISTSDLQHLWKVRVEHQDNLPERRRATYCRVPVGKKVARGSEKDTAARAVSDRLYQAMKGLRFSAGTFAAMCTLTAAGQKVEATPQETQPFAATGRYRGGTYQKSFVDAAFAVPGAGQVSPPTRTNWGWDLVLVTEIAPAQHKTFAEAEDEMRSMLLDSPDMEPYRRFKFLAWARRFEEKAHVEEHPERLPADPLETALAGGDPASGSATGAAPAGGQAP